VISEIAVFNGFAENRSISRRCLARAVVRPTEGSAEVPPGLGLPKEEELRAWLEIRQMALSPWQWTPACGKTVT